MPSSNSQSPRILFVCTGNTCRSPMAEAVFRQMCAQAQMAVEVGSAGVAAWDGAQISEQAKTVLASRDLDGSTHRSRALTRQIVDWADRIVTMTRSHAAEARNQFPDAADKICTLGSLVKGGHDVADPFAGPVALYRACLDDMTPGLNALLEQLKPHE